MSWTSAKWFFLMLVAAPAVAQHSEHASDVAIAGPAHASAYAEGLYLLHNFEYGRAATAFQRAQAEDPGNVMAFWGEAMTYNHPLWAFQATERGRAALAKLGPTPQARAAKARTQRESGWLAAVETLYGEGDKLARDRAYHARMMALHEGDETDIEARSFAALATLGLAHRGRDTAIYMRSAALLEQGFPTHPDHPGVLHYLIHSYDDPAHAPLGLRAARRYARVAPDAGHAQHMVSHIYLALGDWKAVELTNVQAMKVVNAQRAATGRPPTSCGHYNEWLAYAQDQQGAQSGDLIERCQAEALAEIAASQDKSVLGEERSLFNNWAIIAVRHGVDTGRWPTQVAMPDGDHHLLGRFQLAYGRLVAARNNARAAESALQELRRDRSIIAAAWSRERPNDHETAAWLDRAVAQGEAILTLANGERERGLQLLATAASAEAALPQPFGPPSLAKPSGELLGDELLAAGRKADAARSYEQALTAMPNRLLSVIGLNAAR